MSVSVIDRDAMTPVEEVRRRALIALDRDPEFWPEHIVGEALRSRREAMQALTARAESRDFHADESRAMEALDAETVLLLDVLDEVSYVDA